ncbi:LOW QUALITY PROTEIN: hypothetical protein V2J09_000412 [Rumex salicifolius]
MQPSVSPVLLARRLVGAFWYLLEIERADTCWRQACSSNNTTCNTHFLYCSSNLQDMGGYSKWHNISSSVYMEIWLSHLIYKLRTELIGLVKRKKSKYFVSVQSLPLRKREHIKFALDALYIQQGRLAEQKTVNKDELMQMARYGAEMVFSSGDSTITDEDADRIIAKGEEATAELDAKMKKFTEDGIQFKMDDTADLYDFDDNTDENKADLKKIDVDNWIEK